MIHPNRPNRFPNVIRSLKISRDFLRKEVRLSDGKRKIRRSTSANLQQKVLIKIERKLQPVCHFLKEPAFETKDSTAYRIVVTRFRCRCTGNGGSDLLYRNT